MQADDLLACSQEPVICPYLKLDEFSHSILFTLKLLLILSLHLCLGLPFGLLPNGNVC